VQSEIARFLVLKWAELTENWPSLNRFGGFFLIFLCFFFDFFLIFVIFFEFLATVGGWQWLGGSGNGVLVYAVGDCAFFGAKMGGFGGVLAEFESI
jgi:hypothetical protein